MRWQFKAKALEALKGNWQTALFVSFCAGILVTATDLVRMEVPVDQNAASYEALWQSLWTALHAVPEITWALLGILSILSFVFTPVLVLGCNHYFLCRLQGEELGFRGLFSRMNILGKALLLSLVTGLKILAWTLLFIIPGIVAALRYCMAPYYLAEDPTLSVTEAIEKSKADMEGNKWNYVILSLSFFGYILLCSFVQYLLAGVNVIFSLVVYQFLLLVIATYQNGTFASFFLFVGGTKAEKMEE